MTSLIPLIRKALTYNGGFDKKSFPELPRALFLARATLAVVLGIVWPLILGQHAGNLSAFVPVVTLLLIGGQMLYRNYWCCKTTASVADGEKADDFLFDEATLTTEGLVPSIALFVLVWIVVNTVKEGGAGPIVFEAPPAPATISE